MSSIFDQHITRHEITRDQLERDQVLFYDDPRTRRLATWLPAVE